jgi:hypothetical protein
MTRTYTLFEREIVRFIIWTVKGCRERQLSESVAKRMMRACLEGRRMRAPLVGRSVALSEAERGEFDHVVPRSEIVKMLLAMTEPSLPSVTATLETFLVCAEITRTEHRELLKPWARRMPDGWDPVSGDRFARYIAAGIKLHPPPS